jgi:hypothetical protein
VKGWHIEKADISNAYINADMDDEVYVRLPKGFFQEGNKVRKLLKALYGHPRAGRLWYGKLESFLKGIGMVQSQREPCLFYSKEEGCMLCFYVDDFLIATVNSETLDLFFRDFGNQYKTKRLGFPSEFLGMQIQYFPDYNAAILHQKIMY